MIVLEAVEVWFRCVSFPRHVDLGRAETSSGLATFGLLRHQGGRIAEENRLRSPEAALTRLSFTRGALTSTAPATVVTPPGLVVAVTHHQTSPVLVTRVRQLSCVRVDFSLQRGGQNPPRTLPGDLIQQRTAAWRGAVLVDYRKHERAFPTDVPTSALLDDLSIDPSGRYATFPQTDPQVLSIALDSVHGPLVSFRQNYEFAADGQVPTSDSTLRFPARPEIEAEPTELGYMVDEVRDAPDTRDRSGKELVFLARRPEGRPS